MSLSNLFTVLCLCCHCTVLLNLVEGVRRSSMAKKKKNTKLPALSAGLSLVDTHCHLDFADYDTDRPEVIQRAIDAGVTRMVTIGIDLTTSRMAVEIAAGNARVWAAVGVHPHHVSGLTSTDLDEIVTLAAAPKVVAYGEIGMDKVRNYAPLDVQKEKFRQQVALAKELNLPMIIHDREAHDDILSVLHDSMPFPRGGVIHCFSADAALAQEFMTLGFYISIPGVVTFNKAEELQDAVRVIPLNVLLVETDAPFLSPMPKRGRRNEPSHVLYTAKKVAELKGVSLDELAEVTSRNAVHLFGFE